MQYTEAMNVKCTAEEAEWVAPRKASGHTRHAEALFCHYTASSSVPDHRRLSHIMYMP